MLRKIIQHKQFTTLAEVAGILKLIQLFRQSLLLVIWFVLIPLGLHKLGTRSNIRHTNSSNGGPGLLCRTLARQTILNSEDVSSKRGLRAKYLLCQFN